MCKEMLYHYTSIDSFVQILENKSIKFNNLTACDDIDEADSEDLGRAGKYVFVSCWTREAKESIPMWSQYSGNMSGIRIGMKKYPFVRRRFDNRGYGEPFESYLNYQKYFDENKMSFVPNQPILIDVEYVEDEKKIKPCIITEGTIEDVEKFIRGESSKCTLSFDAIGKYKKTCWAFQNECRYKIFGMPMGIKEMNISDAKVSWDKQKEYMRRVMDKSYVPGYQALFLDLDDEAIDDMEIVFGPRMNKSEKILLSHYLKSKGLEKNYRESSLRIQ